MPLVRADVEYILIKRLGRFLTEARLDGTTINGTNTDLSDPIGYALRRIALTVADVTDPTSAEVAGVGSDVFDKFMLIAEIRTLENILQNLTKVDTKVGPDSLGYSDLAKRILELIKLKKKELKDEYGDGSSSLETDVITLAFMQHTDDGEINAT